jgi:hypothetical protein
MRALPTEAFFDSRSFSGGCSLGGVSDELYGLIFVLNIRIIMALIYITNHLWLYLFFIKLPFEHIFR